MWEWLNEKAEALPDWGPLVIFIVLCLVVWFAILNPYRCWLLDRYDYKLFNCTWNLYVFAMALYYWFAPLFVGEVPDTGLWALITPESDPNTLSAFIKTVWFAFPALVLYFLHSLIKTRNIIVSLISFGIMWALGIPLAYLASAVMGLYILVLALITMFGAAMKQTQGDDNTCKGCGKRISGAVMYCNRCRNMYGN